MTRVVLLTDFGSADGYAAAMAGVIAAAAPEALVEHASHDIAPGDLLGAALALSRYAFLYPRGTVHLVVVDPGVGTDRRPLAGTIGGRHFVAPDNGVLTLVLRDADDARLAALDPARLGDAAPALPDGPSATFHGRDLFAPAAARLAAGAEPEDLGARIIDPVELEIPRAAREEEGIYGEVLQVDRFGNLITNVPSAWVAQGDRVWLGFSDAGPVRRTYGDVGRGEPVALVGSIALLEISVRDGDAADYFRAGRGAPVFVTRPGAD